MVWYVYGKTQKSKNSHSFSFFHFCLLDSVLENENLLKSKKHSENIFKGIILFIFNDARICAIMPKTNFIRMSVSQIHLLYFSFHCIFDSPLATAKS